MLLRYSTIETEDLEAMLRALVEQMGSGIASISYNGQSIVYSSIQNINQAIQTIERELARRYAGENNLRVKKGARYPSMPGKGFR